MHSGDKFNSIALLPGSAVLITFFITAKGCNDSDNKVRQEMVNKDCAYFGDSKFDCRRLK